LQRASGAFAPPPGVHIAAPPGYGVRTTMFEE